MAAALRRPPLLLFNVLITSGDLSWRPHYRELRTICQGRAGETETETVISRDEGVSKEKSHTTHVALAAISTNYSLRNAGQYRRQAPQRRGLAHVVKSTAY